MESSVRRGRALTREEVFEVIEDERTGPHTQSISKSPGAMAWAGASCNDKNTEDEELLRKRRQLQLIEEQIARKKASIAMKRNELGQAPTTWYDSDDEIEADCSTGRRYNQGRAKRDDEKYSPFTNKVSQKPTPPHQEAIRLTDRQISLLNELTQPFLSSLKSSMPDAPSTNSCLERRNSEILHKDRTFSPEHRAEMSPSERLAPSNLNPSTETSSGGPPSQGFDRFLSILNQGVDIGRLSDIVTGEAAASKETYTRHRIGETPEPRGSGDWRSDFRDSHNYSYDRENRRDSTGRDQGKDWRETDRRREEERGSNDRVRERERERRSDSGRERERGSRERDRERERGSRERERKRGSNERGKDRGRYSDDRERERKRSSRDGGRERQRDSHDRGRDRERYSDERERKRGSRDRGRERERGSNERARERETYTNDRSRERARGSRDRERERSSNDRDRKKRRDSRDESREKERYLRDRLYSLSPRRRSSRGRWSRSRSRSRSRDDSRGRRREGRSWSSSWSDSSDDSYLDDGYSTLPYSPSANYASYTVMMQHNSAYGQHHNVQAWTNFGWSGVPYPLPPPVPPPYLFPPPMPPPNLPPPPPPPLMLLQTRWQPPQQPMYPPPSNHSFPPSPYPPLTPLETLPTSQGSSDTNYSSESRRKPKGKRQRLNKSFALPVSAVSTTPSETNPSTSTSTSVSTTPSETTLSAPTTTSVSNVPSETNLSTPITTSLSVTPATNLSASTTTSVSTTPSETTPPPTDLSASTTTSVSTTTSETTPPATTLPTPITTTSVSPSSETNLCTSTTTATVSSMPSDTNISTPITTTSVSTTPETNPITSITTIISTSATKARQGRSAKNVERWKPNTGKKKSKDWKLKKTMSLTFDQYMNREEQCLRRAPFAKEFTCEKIKHFARLCTDGVYKIVTGYLAEIGQTTSCDNQGQYVFHLPFCKSLLRRIDKFKKKIWRSAKESIDIKE